LFLFHFFFSSEVSESFVAMDVTKLPEDPLQAQRNIHALSQGSNDVGQAVRPKASGPKAKRRRIL